jgi:hypothetical protein
MDRLLRTTKLYVVCGLALVLIAPAALAASPAKEEYVPDIPTAGSDGGAAATEDSRSGGTPNDDAGALNGVASSGDDGGLPILLVVLAGTAVVGAGIAIMRRSRT